MNCRVIVFSNYLATGYVLLFLLLIHLCHAPLLFSQSPITENQYVENELLISFKKGISKEQITIFENAYQLKRLKEFKHINIYHYQINKSTTVPELIKEIKKIHGFDLLNLIIHGSFKVRLIRNIQISGALITLDKE